MYLSFGLIVHFGLSKRHSYIFFLSLCKLIQVSEGILGLARKCVQLKAPVENDFLFELLLGILGENTQVYLMLAIL